MKHNIIKHIVRKLSAWAWQDEIRTCEGFATINELHVKPGAMTLHINQNPAITRWIVECFANLVASSPNYTEMKFYLKPQEDNRGWITVLVQKGNGKTPHQLRREAEDKCAKLNERVTILSTALKDAISTYNPNVQTTLVTAERQEAWIKALGSEIHA